MASVRGYHNYRGRRTSRGKIALSILLVLVILAAGVVIWGQRYVVYDESGHAHLELPWQEREEEEQNQPEDIPLDLNISSADADLVRGLSLTGTELPEALPAVESGFNAVVLTGKDAAGIVQFPSAAAGTQEGFTAQTLETLRAQCPQVIVRLTACLDPTAARGDVPGMALVRSDTGKLYSDAERQNWLDLEKPAARAYLCSLAKELAELGVDEILLSDVGYPSSGNLDRIAYDEEARAEQVRLFLTELKGTLEPYDVKLSLELPAGVLETGSDSLRGLLLGDAAAQVDRIYAVVAPEQVEAYSAAVRSIREETEFIPILEEAGQAQGLDRFLLAETQ